MADINNTSTDQTTQVNNEANEPTVTATAPAPADTPAQDPAAPAAPVAQPQPSPVSATLPKPQAPKPITKPLTAPVVTKVAPAPNAAPAPTPVDIKALVAKAQAEASTSGKIILQQFVDYMEAMKPRKPITTDLGARYQVGLYRSIVRMINTLNDDFALVFTTFLRLFAEHADGVFNETHVFRFMEHVPLSKEEIASFQRLLNLFTNIADPKGRAAGLKMTDFNKTLEYGISDDGRARVLTYFSK